MYLARRRRYDPGVTTAGRVPLFENVRALLIMLVVMGHALEPLIGREPLARALYTALYLFHIPPSHSSPGTCRARSWTARPSSVSGGRCSRRSSSSRRCM
jgi:hypothetical protein